jgi:hypothetical protein
LAPVSQSTVSSAKMTKHQRGVVDACNRYMISYIADPRAAPTSARGAVGAHHEMYM